MAVERKLRHCPVCGSFVRFDYSNGVIYSLIRWRCTDQGCPMADNWLPLAGWNEENSPNFGVLMETVPVTVGC